MYLSSVSSSSFIVALIAQSLLLIGGLFLTSGGLYYIHAVKTRLRVREKELAALQGETREPSGALIPAERAMSPLNPVAAQSSLAMLQFAHELRSPLAAIQNALDTVLQGYTQHDAQLEDEMLNLARDRAVAMLGQVNEFLRLGAVQHAESEEKAEPVQLLDVLDRLLPEKRVRARSRAVDLVVEVPDSLSTVHADPKALQHLVANLIDNAIKYTHPGGRVTVRLGEDERNVIGTVEDTGIGIAREDLPRIFGGLYRTEEARQMGVDGTGLGLSIAKQVVDRYGGTLDVRSELGRGSRFRFVFPRAEPACRVGLSQGREGAEKLVRLFRHLQPEGFAQGLAG